MPLSNRILDDPGQRRNATARIDAYLDAVENASARTRWLTIVLTTSCVIVFFAHWNTLPEAWLLGRLDVARHARAYFLASESERCALLQGEDGAKYNRGRQLLNQHQMDRSEVVLRIPITFAPDEETQGGATVHGEAVVDLAALSLQHAVDTIEDAVLSDVKVLNVPFLGIAFDVNDLGLMSGLAFAVILLMRKMSLNTERDSVRTLFRASYRKGCTLEAYEIVALKQVLTTPIRNHYEDIGTFRRGMIQVYRALPMTINVAAPGILAAVYATNFRSFDVGNMISPQATLLSMTASGILLVTVAALTCACLKSEIEIHRLMDAVATSSAATFFKRFAIPPPGGVGPG